MMLFEWSHVVGAFVVFWKVLAGRLKGDDLGRIRKEGRWISEGTWTGWRLFTREKWCDDQAAWI